MQVYEFLSVDFCEAWVAEFLQFLQGQEVDVVGGVEGLGGAEDVVGYGDAAAEVGGVFYVVDSASGLVLFLSLGKGRREGGGWEIQ